jgi:hypothetical protein
VTEREVRAVSVVAYSLRMSDHGPVELFPSAPFMKVLAAGAHKAMLVFIMRKAGAVKVPQQTARCVCLRAHNRYRPLSLH